MIWFDLIWFANLMFGGDRHTITFRCIEINLSDTSLLSYIISRLCWKSKNSSCSEISRYMIASSENSQNVEDICCAISLINVTNRTGYSLVIGKLASSPWRASTGLSSVLWGMSEVTNIEYKQLTEAACVLSVRKAEIHLYSYLVCHKSPI